MEVVIISILVSPALLRGIHPQEEKWVLLLPEELAVYAEGSHLEHRKTIRFFLYVLHSYIMLYVQTLQC